MSRKPRSAASVGTRATDHTRSWARTRETATSACFAVLLLGATYALWKIGEHMGGLEDDDHFMLVSCSGREPEGLDG